MALVATPILNSTPNSLVKDWDGSNTAVILWKRTEGFRCSDIAGEVQPNSIILIGFL